MATDAQHGLQRACNMQHALRNAQHARCNMHLRIDDERSLRPSELKDVRDEAARLAACAPTLPARLRPAWARVVSGQSRSVLVGPRKSGRAPLQGRGRKWDRASVTALSGTGLR